MSRHSAQTVLMFTKYHLALDQDNLFDTLSKSIQFEDVVKGRKGAIPVSPQGDQIPLARSTTQYKLPAQLFQPVHYDLMGGFTFNNAMIELYDDRYRTMKAHSDQALDLEPDSYIGIFSCYDKPGIGARKLKIEHKGTGEQSEVVLDHMSLVVFPVSINDQHLHKIVLEEPGNSLWLGITFRTAKTFIEFRDNVPYFAGTDQQLTLATDEERKDFYKCRQAENTQIGYKYPGITYTISPSDLLPILETNE